MGKWIDADTLKENCYKKMDELMESTSEHLSAEALSLLCGFTLIDYAPSIDIVRCKECKWAKANGTYQWCGRLDSTARITDDDFCSYGEREGE